MKKTIILLLLIGIPFSLYGKTEIDTITNWQLYKDKELLFKSHHFDSKIHTGVISSKDRFNFLKLNLFYDFLSDKIHRKIEFIINENVVKSISEFKPARESFIIRREEIDKLISAYHNEVLLIKYTDKVNPNGILIGFLEITD